jgi:hypothetical protein
MRGRAGRGRARERKGDIEIKKKGKRYELTRRRRSTRRRRGRGRRDSEEGLEERVTEAGIRFVVGEDLLDLVDEGVSPALDLKGLFSLERRLVEALGRNSGV